MRTMEDLRRRIGNVQDVQSIVGTMKTMAAAQIRQYESAANSMSEYLRIVELGFHVLQGSNQQVSEFGQIDVGSPTTRGVIVFGSDQGLCGKFNEAIVEHAVSKLSGDTNCKLIVVGNRAGAMLAASIDKVENAEIAHVIRTPITVSDITSVMQRLMPLVSQWQLNGIRPIDIYFNTRTSAASYTPETFRLFPVSERFLKRCKERRWNSRRLPIYTMNHRSLLAAVVRQYLFVGLYRATAESRASENASRIAAMQAASKNIDRRLHELKTEFNESRQAAITEEILDIAAGVEALM